jgi:hypothetical protein
VVVALVLLVALLAGLGVSWRMYTTKRGTSVKSIEGASKMEEAEVAEIVSGTSGLGNLASSKEDASRAPGIASEVVVVQEP